MVLDHVVRHLYMPNLMEICKQLLELLHKTNGFLFGPFRTAIIGLYVYSHTAVL